jgi:outer membrane lipoprotein SlyB
MIEAFRAAIGPGPKRIAAVSKLVVALACLVLSSFGDPGVAQDRYRDNDRYADDRYRDDDRHYDDDRDSDDARFRTGDEYADDRDRDQDCTRCGTVRDVQRVARRGNSGPGAGAVIGAIVGGALGNQVGKGSGRKAATVAGAVAGGVVGHNVQQNNRERRAYFLIEVRMDSGRIVDLEQLDGYGLQPGDRVIVENGQVRPFD